MAQGTDSLKLLLLGLLQATEHSHDSFRVAVNFSAARTPLPVSHLNVLGGASERPLGAFERRLSAL